MGILKITISSVLTKVRMMRDPIAYARSLGIRIGSNVHFYGMRPGMFGSEPWLITIGDNVHITNDVMFITYDGGTLILRREVPDLEWTTSICVG